MQTLDKCTLAYRKPSNKRPRPLFEHLTNNRDPAIIGDPVFMAMANTGTHQSWKLMLTGT